MSIWADIHKRSNGAAVRREDSDWWIGIPGISVIDHGEWADLELSYHGKTLNFYDVIEIAERWYKETYNVKEVPLSSLVEFIRREQKKVKALFEDGKLY